MCTLTYQPEHIGNQKGSRWIIFNRDELRSRPRAIPPSLIEGKNGPYLMPRDPQGGGSWMGMHCSGFFIALLNNYPGDKIIIDPSLRSRGMLVKELLEDGVFPDTELLRVKTAEDLYAPFYLAAFSANSTFVWGWDQQSLKELASEKGIVSSSGYRHGYISALRADLLSQALPEPGERSREALFAFNTLENSEEPSRGILMSRPEARTVSISEIELSPQKGQIIYHERDEMDKPSVQKITFSCA